MSAEEKIKADRAVSHFKTCSHAGTTITIEVDKKLGTKAVLGFCDHYHKKIEIDPTCRICLRYDTKPKKKYKKTPTQRQRISQGRKRQRERKLKSTRDQTKNPFIH